MGMETRSKSARRNAAVPDDVLASIFLRLPSLLHLLRAACACRRWRRVIGDGAFLRDFRALRVPSLVAGHFRVSKHNYGSRPPGRDPEFVPSPSSPLKAEMRLSFDFLPQRRGDLTLTDWEIADRRGAIYLLLNECTNAIATPLRFPDLVVCDPLSRRYAAVPLPPPPHLHGCRCIGAFLLNDDGGPVMLSRFRVMCVVFRYGVTRVYVFSSVSGLWAVKRCTADYCGLEIPPGLHSFFFAGESGGYAHWASTDDFWYQALLALDMDKAELLCFSLPVPPEGMSRWSRHGVRAVRKNRGALCVVCHGKDSLMVFTQEEHGGWAMDAWVLLSQATSALPGYMEWYWYHLPGRIISEAQGVVLISPSEVEWLVSVNIETMEFKPAAGGMTYPYILPWPPAGLCSPADDLPVRDISES